MLDRFLKVVADALLRLIEVVDLVLDLLSGYQRSSFSAAA
jgi:hypothetical protein